MYSQIKHSIDLIFWSWALNPELTKEFMKKVTTKKKFDSLIIKKSKNVSSNT